MISFEENPLTLAAGTHLGRYEIRSQIGAGGMGEVYLALDTELDRTVAIKILPEAVASNQRRLQRFIQEAKAASALNHPHIITIHEIGTTGATPFIATEFIDGETLRPRITGGMKLPEILEISIQAGGALAAAHAAGIIHRDIKPENIMVRRDGYIKLLDFGLAKLTEPSFIDSEAPTRAIINTGEGMVMGTANYMSPEQAKGTQVDVRTDLWSLGAVLYEMVSGHTPFGGKTPTETISLILQKEPAPLSRYVNEVPAELERIVTKALTKDREERYQTAKDLLIDLRNLKRKLEVDAEIDRTVPSELRAPTSTSGGQSTPATASGAAVATAPAGAPPVGSSAEYIVSGIKQHKLASAIAVFVLVIGAVGLSLYLHARNTEVAIESIAVLPFVNASGNPNMEYLSDGISESLTNSLSQLPNLKVKARSTVFRYKGQAADPQKVGSELSVQAVLSGRVLQHGDDLTLSLELVDARTGNQLWGEQYHRKLTDLVALQSEIARDVSQKLRLRLTSAEQKRLTKRGTENNEAYQAYLKGRYYWSKKPAPGYEKSRDYFQQAIDLDPAFALAYSGLADYYGFASAVGLLPPNENWPKAEAAANKALALDDTLAETYNPLAAVKLYYYRDWPAAERYFRRAIELNPSYAEVRIHYAGCLVRFGRDEEALAEVQRAVELDPLSLGANLLRGRTLFFIRQYDRAIDQFRKTLELESTYVPAHEWLGDAYEQKGMHKEAIAEWGKALTLSGAGEQASSLERNYAASGFDAAVRALAQQRLEKLNERMKRGEYVPAIEYVTAYIRLGDKEQAFAWLDKAVQERNGAAFDLKVNPSYDKLRDDPRFADLVRRTGLPL